jgi:hypothetical protein
VAEKLFAVSVSGVFAGRDGLALGGWKASRRARPALLMKKSGPQKNESLSRLSG